MKIYKQHLIFLITFGFLVGNITYADSQNNPQQLEQTANSILKNLRLAPQAPATPPPTSALAQAPVVTAQPPIVTPAPMPEAPAATPEPIDPTPPVMPPPPAASTAPEPEPQEEEPINPTKVTLDADGSGIPGADADDFQAGGDLDASAGTGTDDAKADGEPDASAGTGDESTGDGSAEPAS